MARKYFKVLTASVHNTGRGPLPSAVEKVLGTTVTLFGEAARELLEQVKDSLEISRDDKEKIFRVDLVLSCPDGKIEKARELAAKDPPPAKTDKGPKEAARPRWPNSYRLIKVEKGTDGVARLRFRLAERFSWCDKQGSKSGLDEISATFFQGLLKSWGPEIRTPSELASGVCQEVAQQTLSHIGLIDSETQATTAFPTGDSRDPKQRAQTWYRALQVASLVTDGFERTPARYIFVGKYAEGDPRGNRLITSDHRWWDVQKSPFPARMSPRFVQSKAVVIYRRDWQDARGRNRSRLYAAVPIFSGRKLPEELADLAGQDKLFWWQKHRDEFKSLSFWNGAKLPRGNTAILVALACDENHLVSELTQPNTKVCWSFLVEKKTRKRQRRGKKGRRVSQSNRSFEIHLTIKREVESVDRGRVLGVHFGPPEHPIISWALADAESGKILEEGSIAGNDILSEALKKKLRLEVDQKELRWIGDKRFQDELKRRTNKVVRAVLDLAASRNAYLAVERIKRVDKQSGSPDQNSRYSFWNFGQLRQLFGWKGLDRPEGQQVQLVADVGEYLLRFTCPNCGACRKAKQTKENADTWRENHELHCRKCDFAGSVSDGFQARLVAEEGVARLKERKRSAA